jgi:hypothetical protein
MEGSSSSIMIRCYPGIFLEGLRKTVKHLSQDSRSPGWNLNTGSPEYEAEVLTTRPLRSVILLKNWIWKGWEVWHKVTEISPQSQTTHKQSRHAQRVFTSVGICNYVVCLSAGSEVNPRCTLHSKDIRSRVILWSSVMSGNNPAPTTGIISWRLINLKKHEQRQSYTRIYVNLLL